MTTPIPMTPMRRLNSGLQKLKDSLNPYFKDITLNKSRRKSYNSGWEYISTKGVENDFVLIMKAHMMEASFAFAFTYMDLPQQDHRVEVSIKRGKENETIINSPLLTIDEFREYLNLFNKTIENITYSNRIGKEIINLVMNTFGVVEPDIKMTKKYKEDFKSFLETRTKELNIEELENNVDVATKNYNAKVTVVNNSVSSIEKEIILLTKKLENERNALIALHNLPQLEKNTITAMKELDKAKQQLNKDLENTLKKIPKNQQDFEILEMIKSKKMKQ